METKSTPPVFPTGLRGGPAKRPYPDPETALGHAWAAAWRELAKSGAEYVDGTELAARSAVKANLSPNTMITLFTRAATAGLLERTHREAPTGRGVRRRTFYRVPQ